MPNFHKLIRTFPDMPILGKSCEIDAAKDEFLTVAREPTIGRPSKTRRTKSAPIGAIVMVFRATAFFVPEQCNGEDGRENRVDLCRWSQRTPQRHQRSLSCKRLLGRREKI